MTIFYHRTSSANARAILAGGFKDATGTYLTNTEWTGVWLSDSPLDENDGASGDVLLAVEIDPELINPYEWVEAGKAFREFLVPAAIINGHAKVFVHKDDTP